jgi:hypothetical protein
MIRPPDCYPDDQVCLASGSFGGDCQPLVVAFCEHGFPIESSTQRLMRTLVNPLRTFAHSVEQLIPQRPIFRLSKIGMALALLKA